MGNINFVNKKNSEVTVRHYVERFFWIKPCCTIYTTVLKPEQELSIPNNINEYFTIERGQIKSNIIPDEKTVKHPSLGLINAFNEDYIRDAIFARLIQLYYKYMNYESRVNNFYSKTIGSVNVEIV